MALASFFIMSCGDGENLSQREQLNQYVAENNITNLDSINGMWFVMNDPGGDEKPVVSDAVNITYDGYYIDQERFDANENITFGLNSLIAGWQIGIPLIGRGGDIKLIIPPNLAYGPNPTNGIRRNAILIFDVQLHDF